jgi:hypothetical protein
MENPPSLTHADILTIRVLMLAPPAYWVLIGSGPPRGLRGSGEVRRRGGRTNPPEAPAGSGRPRVLTTGAWWLEGKRFGSPEKSVSN